MNKQVIGGMAARCGTTARSGAPLLARVVFALIVSLPGMASAYTLFESAPGRSLAISSTGDRLYATNIADGRL